MCHMFCTLENTICNRFLKQVPRKWKNEWTSFAAQDIEEHDHNLYKNTSYGEQVRYEI